MDENKYKEVVRHLLMICAILFIISSSCSAPIHMTGWRHSREYEVQRYKITQKDLAQFTDSLRPRRQDPDSLYRNAIFLQSRNKHKLALQLLEEAILADLEYVKAYNAMGFSFDYLRDYPRAIKAYQRALKLNPDLAYVHNNLGYSYFLQGDFDSAIVAFEDAIALDPQNARYHNNLGLAYARKGLYDLALAEFKNAGDDAKARYNMAQIYARAEQYPKAKSHISAASKKDTAIRPTDMELPRSDLFAHATNIQQENRAIHDSANDPEEERYAVDRDAEETPQGTDEKYEIAYSSEPVVVSPPLSTADIELLQEKTGSISGIPELPNDRKKVKIPVDKGFGNSRNVATRSFTENFVTFERKDDGKPKIKTDSYHQKNDARRFNFLDAFDDEHARIIENPELKEIGKREEIDRTRSLSKVEIEVSNGIGVKGIAGRVSGYLRERGFNVTRQTNASYVDHKNTKIFYDRGELRDARQLLDEIPIPPQKVIMIALKRLKNKIRLLIGKDMVPYDETTVNPKDEVTLYPYSIQLSSCRLHDSADKVLCNYQKDDLVPYIVQDQLGEGDIWWRVFVGHYKTRREALRARKAYDLSDSIVKKTPYSNLISTFSTQNEAKDSLRHLQLLGFSPYIVRSDKKTFRIVAGAFSTKQRAEKNKLALQLKGIQNQVVRR